MTTRRRKDCVVSCFTNCGVFYGWPVFAAATFGKVMTSPGQSPCIGVAVDAIRSSLDMSRTKVPYSCCLDFRPSRCSRKKGATRRNAADMHAC